VIKSTAKTKINVPMNSEKKLLRKCLMAGEVQKQACFIPGVAVILK